MEEITGNNPNTPRIIHVFEVYMPVYFKNCLLRLSKILVTLLVSVLRVEVLVLLSMGIGSKKCIKIWYFLCKSLFGNLFFDIKKYFVVFGVKFRIYFYCY